MKTWQVILVTLISLGLLLAAAFFAIGYFQPKPGGLLVDTEPDASVYVNGILVGKTKYNGTYKAGEINLKLVPDRGDLIPFETKITLTPGIQTVVRREFGKTEDESSGDIIFFDKLGSKETSLVVVSTPENAQIALDGVPRGFAPYKTSTISPANHQITIKAPGYLDRIMTVKVIAGYRLSIFAKLSKSKETTQQVLPSPTPAPKKYVEILETPTGFLRVRTEPGTKGEEIAEVKPGSKYLYLDEDPDTGWYKIQYEDPKPGLPSGIVGWITNQYSKIVDE